MPRLFDSYIMVDWSAASAPKTGKDSIWIAELNANAGRVRFNNPPTRNQAYSYLVAALLKQQSKRARVLLGFDFSIGYPVGTASALGLVGTPWASMHDWLANMIDDDETNANNRFEIAQVMNNRISGTDFPFWGATSKKFANDFLSPKKPNFPEGGLSERREVERYLRREGLGTPKSAWQLAYIGSVGSQSLMGIPYISRLRREFPSAQLWPFETGFKSLTQQALQDTKIVIAEIYPSLVKAEPKHGEPLDKAQVRAIARHYWELDNSGQLGAAFAPPSALNAQNLSIIEKEEGWILGITPINIGNLAS